MERIQRNVEATEMESLVQKLIEFDSSLSPAERVLFRHRIAIDMLGDDDVEGHAMEMRWNQGPEGLFRGWVEVADGEGRAIDPRLWNSLSRSSSVQESNPSPARQAEASA